MSTVPAARPIPCPDPTTLGKFLRAELAGAEAAAVERHVNTCADCQRALQGMVGSLPRTIAAIPTASAVEDELPAIPGHEILGVLGEGGMGVVYRARQTGLNREVALKTILRADASRTTLARFWAEAETMAAVKHPHVVQVFELGEHAGRPFMTMELVTGGSLAGRLFDDGHMSARGAADMVEKIARGVAAAHDLGIVHRDLKPANVLLTDDGEPKVADFGLAKWRSTDLTRTQAVMGTPAYMAPEQAAGRARFVGPTADVWALGVILYECLAGERPFKGDTADVLLSQVQSAEPAPLRKCVRGLSRDLDTIVAKCLAKEPDRRYPTAAELADDLARFLRREPIAARPVGRVERLVRWARRKPTAAAAYGLTALAAVLALVVFVVAGLWREAEGAKKDADDARGRVEGLLGTEKKLRGDLQTANSKLEITNADLKNKKEELETANGKLEIANGQLETAQQRLVRFNYGQIIKAAYQAWRDNKLAEARTLLARARRLQPDLCGWEYDYVHRLCYADLVTFSHADERGDIAPLNHASWNADESRVLTASESHGRVWDTATGEQLWDWSDEAGTQIGALAWAPDGSKFLIASYNGTTRIRDAVSRKVLCELKGSAYSATAADWTADGTKVLTCPDRLSKDPTARVWNAATGDLITELKGHKSALYTAVFSPDGSKALTASEDTTARVWDAVAGKVLAELKGHTGRVSSAAWSPDGTKVVTGGWDKAAFVWDALSGEKVAELKGHTDFVHAAAFSPDGSKVLTAGADRTARLWDTATGKALAELTGHTDAIVCASFSRDGALALTGSRDRTARVWSADGKFLNELRGHAGEIVRASFNRDASKVLTASRDKTARVWDALRTVPATELVTNREPIGSACWNPDGSKLVTANTRSPIVIWDTKSLGRHRQVRVAEVRFAVWSRDGTKLFTPVGLESPHVWDITAGAHVVQFKAKQNHTLTSVWSADGSKVLTSASDAHPRIWDARAGTVLVEMEREKGETGGKVEVQGATFNPDETRVLAHADRVARIWDAVTGKRLVEFKGHTMPIRVAVWSPDGTKVVTGAADYTARIWDAATGRQLHLLKGHDLAVNHAIWSADGTTVLTAGSDGTPRLWDTATGALLVEFTGHAAAVTSVSWFANGSRVLTCGLDQTLRLWDTRSGAELLALPAAGILTQPPFAETSPDGTRILTRGTSGQAVIYDPRPVNRAFVR